MWRRSAQAIWVISVLSFPCWGEPVTDLWTEAVNAKVYQERSLLTKVATEALPAVVSLMTLTNEEDEEAGAGYGSAFVIHAQGYLLTASHVVEGAREIRAQVPNPQGLLEEYEAHLVGLDEETDIALLKIHAPRDLPVLKLSSSKHVQVADWVVVIGNPFGLSQSVSVGVISFVGRSNVFPQGRSGQFDYLQTDASINPGNSGGPILDVHGNVIAIANAVNVSGQGIGFGTPIDLAKSVLPQLLREGKVTPGWVGVTVDDLTSQRARQQGMTAYQGVLVTHVQPESPAEEAGLQEGDVITLADQTPTRHAHTLRWYLFQRTSGQQVEMQILRDGQPRHIHVKLSQPPADLD